MNQYEKLKKILELLNQDDSKGYMSYNIDQILKLDITEDEYDELFAKLDALGLVNLIKSPDETLSFYGNKDTKKALKENGLREMMQSQIQDELKEEKKARLDIESKEEAISKSKSDRRAQRINLVLTIIAIIISIMALIISYQGSK